MLPDGTNPEGVDPEPPLGWTKDNMKDVKFYGVFGSAPCNKIRAYLKHFKVPFTMVNCQTKPGGDTYYKKMPVIDVNERQVNDSAIIIKNLAPTFFGTFDEVWENKITYCLLYDMEGGMSKEEVADWAFHPTYGFGIPGCMRCCVSGMIYDLIQTNVNKATDKEKNPQAYMKVKRNNDAGVAIMKEFLAEVGDKKFHGGDEIDQVDLSMYATLMPFYSVVKAPSVVKAVEDAGLVKWWANMESVLPTETLYPAAGAPDCSKPM